MKLTRDPGLIRTWLVAALALATGLVVTALVTDGAARAREEQFKSVFERRADNFQTELSRRLELLQSILIGGRAVYEIAGRMDDADVLAYTRSRGLDKDATDIWGIGVVERIPRSELNGFIRRQRTQGRPEFSVRGTEVPGDLFILRSVHPLQRNDGAVGVNLAATPELNDAIQLAMDTGEPTLSAPVRIEQDPAKRTGWIFLVPTYAGHPETVSQRRAALAGLAYAAVVADEALAPIPELLGDSVRFRVFDGAADKRLLIYDSHRGRTDDLAQIHTSRHLLIGNRVLTIDLQSTDALRDPTAAHVPLFVGAAGLVLSALLALSAWLLLSSKTRAQRLAESMTADLRRMALIVERTTGGAFMADGAGRIVWANLGFEELVGRSQKSLVGRSMARLLGEVVGIAHEDEQRMHRDLASGKGHRSETQGHRLDGSSFWADIQTQPIVDTEGGITGYVGIAIDITPRKLAELSAQASGHLMRLITDNIPARLSYWDADLRCQFVNQRFCDFFGQDRTLMVGQLLSESIYPGDTIDLVRPHLDGVFRGETRQYELSSGEGAQMRTWLVHYVPDLRDGKVVGFFALASDVTDLRRARDLALTASQAKSTFLSSMSHEIRTPMNAIVGMLALLDGTAMDHRQRDYAQKALGAARSLLSLLNDILDLSKIEAGRMELDCRSFSVEVLLSDLAIILSNSVGSKDLDVVYDIDPQLPPRLVGDDMRLRQILINLGSNAIKFSTTGEVVIGMKVLRASDGIVGLRVEVRDTGIGMSENEQDLLFADYAQANRTIARTFGGTGLGLGICRKLVALMGSELRMESRQGAGSRFWFDLEMPAASDETGPAGASSHQVLLIEDRTDTRELLANACRAAGWMVQCAADFGEALHISATARERFSAVLLGWRPSDAAPGDEMRQLLSMGASAGAKLVVLTSAIGREMFGGAASAAVADHVLTMPVTPASLVAALSREASESHRPDAARDQQERPLAGARLLVVEDNMINQQIAFELLTSKGAQVDVASDGEQAIALLRGAGSYDLVLMDMMMPVLDGLSATRYIRGELGMHELPIVAMTANAMEKDRAACLAAGMNDHISKPFDMDDLVATVLRLARSSSSRVAARAI